MGSVFRSRSPRRAATWAALAIAVALVLMQTLGALHRVAHGASFGSPSHVAVGIATVEPSTAPTGWLDRLFAGHHASGHDCDAFDQASHGDLAGGLAVLDVAVLPPAVVPLPAHASWHLAAQARGFLARGPPTLA